MEPRLKEAYKVA